MGNSDEFGLVKFDFLGLKTLTVIDHHLTDQSGNLRDPVR